jgi:hypothetical protein
MNFPIARLRHRLSSRLQIGARMSRAAVFSVFDKYLNDLGLAAASEIRTRNTVLSDKPF